MESGEASGAGGGDEGVDPASTDAGRGRRREVGEGAGQGMSEVESGDVGVPVRGVLVSRMGTLRIMKNYLLHSIRNRSALQELQ